MFKKTVLFTYIIVITGLSLLPSHTFPISGSELFPHADKVVHFGMYAIFTFLLFYTWPHRFSGTARQFLPLLYVIIWGSSMEILQEAGNFNRSFSHMDILANILGFFPGWIAWRWFNKNHQKDT